MRVRRCLLVVHTVQTTNPGWSLVYGEGRRGQTYQFYEKDNDVFREFYTFSLNDFQVNSTLLLYVF